MTDFKIKMAELAAKYNISHKRDIDWHNFVYEVEELTEAKAQPEAELEEEMTAYIERHFHIRYDETLEVGNDPITTHDFEKIARHFAEWGAIHLNARKEE